MGEKMSLWVGFAGAFTAWGSSTEPAETGEAAGAGDGMPGEYAGPRRSLSSVSPRPSSNSLTSEPFSSSRISRISFRFIGIPSHALDVGSGTRVHLDHVPLVQEEGDRHEGAGLQPRRLGRSAHRVSAETGLGFHDLQVDEERNVDPDRLPPVEEDLHGKVLDQVVPRLLLLFLFFPVAPPPPPPPRLGRGKKRKKNKGPPRSPPPPPPRGRDK